MSIPTENAPRIAFLGARGVPARYGGFETFVEEIGARLVERGIDVTVFCEAEPRLFGGAGRLGAHRGMHLQYVMPWAPGPARTIQVDVTGLIRATAGFDLVVLLGYGAAFAAWLPRVCGAKVWINPDGLEWQRSKWGRPAKLWLSLMEKIACRTADRLIFDNGALADVIGARAGGRLPEHSVLAYGAEPLGPGIDPEPLNELGLTPGMYDLLLCRFEPENHVAEIVEAHRRAAPDRPLVAVANTEVGTTYARETVEQGQGHVRFLGSIYDPSVLAPLRQNARLYMHGHSVGGTNPSLLEAMGAGSVVLAHDNPFNREVLGPQDVYWRDVGELVERIQGWSARTPEDLQGARDRNRQRIEEDYSWERLADQYARLIHADVVP